LLHDQLSYIHDIGSSWNILVTITVCLFRGFAASSNRQWVQQAVYLHAALQLWPENHGAGVFERPVGALLGLGFNQPI
jgi:hypothetical protein